MRVHRERSVANNAAMLVVVATSLAWMIGCDSAPREFAIDRPLHLANSLTNEQSETVSDLLTRLFGTPDSPRLPSVEGVDGWLDINALSRAAGQVIAYEPGVTRGLYRRHCARCHGLSGDGQGPTSLYQHPYPRDFRRGVFKWKQTWRASKPTRVDLDRVLQHGVAGTAMPAFGLLSESDRDALRQYVVFLSLRGELERELVWQLADGYGEADAPGFSDGAQEQQVIDELLAPIVRGWLEADSQIVQVASTSGADPLELGKTLFHSEQAGCAKCHGDAGRGGASPEEDFDVWARERVEFGSSDAPLVRDALARRLPAKPAGAPRLAGELPRGGSAYGDLYRRVHQGIAGTTMPAVGPRRPGEGAALTDEQIAALTVYVRSLMKVEPTDG